MNLPWQCSSNFFSTWSVLPEFLNYYLKCLLNEELSNQEEKCFQRNGEMVCMKEQKVDSSIIILSYSVIDLLVYLHSVFNL